jgi:hypothetical protein
MPVPGIFEGDAAMGKSATLRVVRGRHKPGLQLAIIASERPSGGRGIGVSFCRGPFEDF